MRFLLLGASGRTGKHVISELLSQGHTAVALVRTPTSLAPQTGLTTVIGSPLDKADIQKALATSSSPQISAAIMTLNTVRASDSPFASQVSPPRFLANSCAAVCQVLKAAGINRIVVMSTAGVGDSWRELPWLSQIFMSWTNIKYALADHNLVDREIRQTDMEYTLVRAVRLRFDSLEPTTKRRRSNVRVLGANGKGMRMTDSINVADVARFLTKVAIQGLYVRAAIVVTS